jgi:L-ascorbate metabolism protein UlaG (beta-lactamase superfamily)
MKLLLLTLILAIGATAQTRPTDKFDTSAGPLTVTAIRHASLVIQAGGKVIHVDPWSQANYDGVPQADLILITDIHGDHMDPKAIAAVRRQGAQIVAPAEVAKTVTDATVIKNGETKKIGDIAIEAIPMYNEKRGPSEGRFFHDKGRGNGYVVTYGGKRLYIAGDTEGVPEMRALKNIDVAFIPMNLPYTMPPEEAAEAVKAFRPKVVYPYHYRQSDTKIFADALKGTGVEVRQWNWYY